MTLSSVVSSLLLTVTCTQAALLAADNPYVLGHDQAIGGDGRWDYVTCSSDGSLLFAPRSSHTQVIDLGSGKIIADIPKTDGSHGVALDEGTGRGFISNGSSVTVFDLTSYKTLGTIAAADDADCIINDTFSKHILVFCGDSGVMVPIKADVELSKGKADAAVDLGGEPEFAVSDGKGHVYANIKNKAEIVAINTTTMKIEHRFPLAPGANPTGLAMDTATHRLFSGCRNKVLVIMNADDGTVVAHFPIGSGVDATAFYKGMVFASCGDGTLTIVHEDSADAFTLAQTLTTQRGARTMAINPHTGAVYLPTAEFAPTPPGDATPHQRPSMIPGTFHLAIATPGVSPTPPAK